MLFNDPFRLFNLVDFSIRLNDIIESSKINGRESVIERIILYCTLVIVIFGFLLLLSAYIYMFLQA